ncbi:MAG: glycosyltransferase family 2 protein [Candidatus Rokubacteria bacterium]|nr:glycosyltransferase family 2 protein [Candidatus Rokubacteria bacterium]
MRPELAVVIPAYNEEAAIGAVVERWSAVLERLKIDYEIRVYDDGSRDGTAAALAATAATNARVLVAAHPNRGHGPTILRGYHEAKAEWVFQVDGDGEGPPEAFEALWAQRETADLLVGRRVSRVSPLPRRLITAACRLAVRALFGAAIHDVNCPYRLMRGASLHAVLVDVPVDTFAPNAVIVGLAARRGLRTREMPIVWEGRRTGTVSIVGRRLWKGAFRAFREALAISRRARR